MHFTWQTSPQTPHTGTAAFDSILEIGHNEGILHVSILTTLEHDVGCFNKIWAKFYTSSQFDNELINLYLIIIEPSFSLCIISSLSASVCTENKRATAWHCYNIDQFTEITYTSHICDSLTCFHLFLQRITY